MSERPTVRIHPVAGHAGVTLAAGQMAFTAIPELSMLGVGLSVGDATVVAPHRPLEDYVTAGHTLGVPLLAPWANRLASDVISVGDATVDARSPLVGRDPAGLPMHGTMAARGGWWVSGAGVEGDSAVLSATYAFDEDPDQLAVFPFPHRLSVTHRLSAGGLENTVTLSATGEVAVPVSFGWHPYFRLPGPARGDWVLEMPERIQEFTDDSGLPTGEVSRCGAESQPLGGRTLDDSFELLGSGGVVFALSGGGLRVEVEMGAAYRHAQVFAPAEHDVVAIEPMTAPVDALSTGRHAWVAPGESHSATFRVRVLA